MNAPHSPGLYCIPCCTCSASALPCAALPPATAQGCRGAAEGGGGAAATPRGGSNRRAGWPDETGAPLHARESKTPAPLPCDWVLRCKVADLVHLLAYATITTPSEGDAGQARRILDDLRGML